MELRDVIQKAEGQPPEPLRPWLGVIGSLANLLLAVSESSGAALGNFLLIDSDGMTPEMVAYAERLHHKEQTFSFHAHSLNAVALDLQNRMAHGHTQLGTLNLSDLNASLRGSEW